MRVALFLLVSLGAELGCWGFVSHNLPSLCKRTSKPAYCQMITPSREDSRTFGLDLRKAMTHGFFSCLLLTSPALDLITHTDSSVAFAQGATSSKSTRAAPSVDANKDPESILRLSLPIVNSKNVIREAQALRTHHYLTLISLLIKFSFVRNLWKCRWTKFFVK